MIFDRLGTLVARHWALVLLAWLILVVAIGQIAPRWDDVTHDGDFAYLPKRMTSVRGQKILEAGFPDFYSKSQVVLVVARPGGELEGPDYTVARRLVERFSPKENIPSPITLVWGPDSPIIGKRLISQPGSEGQALLVILHLDTEFMAIDNMALLAEIRQMLDALRGEKTFPRGLRLEMTGSAAIGSDMLFSAEESIRSTELTTMLLVVIILLLVYRAPALVVIPLVTIGASVFLSMDLVALLAEGSRRVDWLDFKIFKTTKIFIVVILFGAGTDYCLFLISRYKEELGRGKTRHDALAEALARVGDALAASALTTVLGLGMMFFADFGKFTYSGPAIALCLLVALAASVTLAPALLRATGRIVFWPFANDGSHSRAGKNRIASSKTVSETTMATASASRFGKFWDSLSRAVLARPGWILGTSVLLLAPLAWQGLSVPITYDLLSELRPDRPSVRGTRLLARYFPPGQTGPVTVVAYRKDAQFDAKEGRRAIAHLTRELAEFEYTDSQGQTMRPILAVRSLTEPLGSAPGSFNPLSTAGLDKLLVLRHARTKARFVSEAPPYLGKITRFELILPYDPFSRESIRLLDAVESRLQAAAGDRESEWHGTQFDFTGTTAGIRDLAEVTRSDQFRIQLLVVLAVLAVLVLILRHPLICVYLIVSVLFGYFVTIGSTKLVFTWLHGETFTGLDWKVPIFLFVILIAVGEDYNIYLITRVFEEQRRLGPLEGLRVAMARTGGIITSCGVIMAGTFASMATGTLRTMHELGFALSMGVLLDTFVIRTILVPAFLALWYRRKEGNASKNPAR